MILYVNGDSHTAAAEAVNSYAFAEDDPSLNYLGRLPHPENLAVSWGKRLSENLKAAFKCDAESASSNDRILRTARSWLKINQDLSNDLLVIIQWSTWERQEWQIDDSWYQVNASGVDWVPESHRQKYKEFVAGVNWSECTHRAHDQIWEFHQELNDQGIKHIFFNGNSHFGSIDQLHRRDWQKSFLDPYDSKMTFNQWLLDRGFQTVAPNSYHFGKEAHGAWARFMLQYVISNKLI